MRALPVLVLGPLALALLGCSRGAPERAPETWSSTDTAGIVDTSADSAQPSPWARQWVVDFDGVGPLRIGMTKAEAHAALGMAIDWPDVPDESCAYGSVRGMNDAVSFLIADGRIGRVDVKSPRIPTRAGARIGDTEAHVRQLYGAAVLTEPHKYQAGHYLIVPAPGDTTRRLIFETNVDTVTTYRAGIRPIVDWVEGCS